MLERANVVLMNRQARRGIAVRLALFGLALATSTFGFAAKPAAKASATHVPPVGCPSDGQAGPLEAPDIHDKIVELPAAIAARLAYYKAQNGLGLLGPRGWHCFATYGSNGENLFVSQEEIRPANLFSSDWKGFSGPAIELAVSIGDTSGRFKVAEVVARVFPAHAAFTRRVVAEGIQPASSFPVGPYPADHLTRRGNEVVEFETPANAEGLGTHSYLQEGDGSISGVVALFGPEPNLLQLSMRLPSDANDLAPFIIRHAERSAIRAGH